MVRFVQGWEANRSPAGGSCGEVVECSYVSYSIRRAVVQSLDDNIFPILRTQVFDSFPIHHAVDVGLAYQIISAVVIHDYLP